MVLINLQHNLKWMRCVASEIQWGRLSFKVIIPIASCSVVKKSSPMKNMRENIPWVTTLFQIGEDQFAVFLQITDKCDSIIKRTQFSKRWFSFANCHKNNVSQHWKRTFLMLCLWNSISLLRHTFCYNVNLPITSARYIILYFAQIRHHVSLILIKFIPQTFRLYWGRRLGFCSIGQSIMCVLFIVTP